jgi:hypothetical protein
MSLKVAPRSRSDSHRTAGPIRLNLLAYAGDAHIEEISPSGGVGERVGEKRPHDFDRSTNLHRSQTMGIRPQPVFCLFNPILLPSRFLSGSIARKFREPFGSRDFRALSNHKIVTYTLFNAKLTFFLPNAMRRHTSEGREPKLARTRIRNLKQNYQWPNP